MIFSDKIHNFLLHCLLILYISSTQCRAIMFSGCEITIRSGVDNSTGVVTTPGFEENGKYEPNTKCLFKFIGKKNERVKIDFIKFMVRGTMPECINDYVDIWIEVPSESTNLVDSPLFGRYCGVDHLAGPYTTVSLTNMYVLAFFADDQYEAKGLKMQYEFISAEPFNMGKPAPSNVCGWTVNKKKGKKDKTGEIMTPNYPGMYPAALFCFYKFKGRPGDRIRLDFSYFNLYGDDNILVKPKHCPYDHIRIYDGFTNEAPLVGVYCWKSQPFSVYSAGHELLVEFVSKVGHDLMNFGFKASYVISDSFVDLKFIAKAPTTKHIPGTECDQRVMSAGESRGELTSPNFPRSFPIGIKCDYFIDGLENRQDLEVSVLRFNNLDIPATDAKCSNGSVSVFVQKPTLTPPSYGTKVTKISHSLNLRSPEDVADFKFCGSERPPDEIVGIVPRTLLTFDSRHVKKAAKGFKVQYQFIKRYGVRATMAPTSACTFLFNSGLDGANKDGAFSSPRFAQSRPYSDDLNCDYTFVLAPGEQVMLHFGAFSIDSNADRSSAAGRCVDDVVEVRNVFPGGAESLVGLFCGLPEKDKKQKLLFPVASDPKATKLKVHFRSNSNPNDANSPETDTATGFAGSYSFLSDRLKSLERSNCVKQISNSPGGTIAVKDYEPGKYCQWRIRSHRGGRILLTVNSNSLEDDKAVLRAYKDASASPNSFPEQIHTGDGTGKEVISDDVTMNLEFIAFVDAAGDKGFKLGWAELKTGSDCPSSHFKCKKSSHCISRQLVCDETAHCGVDPTSSLPDGSDELENCAHVWPPSPAPLTANEAPPPVNTNGGNLIAFLVLAVCSIVLRV